MNTRNIVYLAILILIAVVAWMMLKVDISREDLGQLTVAAHDSNKRYCTYKIKEARPEEGVDAYYKVGDKICIECCDGSPPGVGVNQLCYTYITFTSGDGHVEYDADVLDRTNRVCNTCGTVRGHYACAN